MKHSYFLLIIASMLFIPSINLDAAKEKPRTYAEVAGSQQTIPGTLPQEFTDHNFTTSEEDQKQASDYVSEVGVNRRTSEDFTLVEMAAKLGETIEVLNASTGNAASSTASDNNPEFDFVDTETGSDDFVAAETDSDDFVDPETYSDTSEDSTSAETDATLKEAMNVEIDAKRKRVAEVTMDPKLSEAINFCRQEGDGIIFSGPVSHALKWTSKQTITSEENPTAKQEMTDGLRELLKKSENDLEKITKLTSKDAKIQLKKTKFLIETKEILEQIEKRLRVGNLIINNDNVQLNEADLKNYIKVGKDYNKQLIIIAGIELDFKLTSLERIDKIGARINKKSLNRGEIGYKPLDFQKIIDQLAGTTNNDVEYGTVSDDDNDSDIDDETQTICREYSSPWSSFFYDKIRKALILASQLTVDEGQDTIVEKELSFGLRELFKRNRTIPQEVKNSTKSIDDDEVQLEIIRLKSSNEMHKNLERARYILKTKIPGIQFDEADLRDFYIACQKESTEGVKDLNKAILLVQDKIQAAQMMSDDAYNKLMNPHSISYKLPEASCEVIFTSAMQSFQELNDAAAKARQSAKELTETEES